MNTVCNGKQCATRWISTIRYIYKGSKLIIYALLIWHLLLVNSSETAVLLPWECRKPGGYAKYEWSGLPYLAFLPWVCPDATDISLFVIFVAKFVRSWFRATAIAKQLRFWGVGNSNKRIKTVAKLRRETFDFFLYFTQDNHHHQKKLVYLQYVFACGQHPRKAESYALNDVSMFCRSLASVLMSDLHHFKRTSCLTNPLF